MMNQTAFYLNNTSTSIFTKNSVLPICFVLYLYLYLCLKPQLLPEVHLGSALQSSTYLPKLRTMLSAAASPSWHGSSNMLPSGEHEELLGKQSRSGFKEKCSMAVACTTTAVTWPVVTITKPQPHLLQLRWRKKLYSTNVHRCTNKPVCTTTTVT